MTHFALLLRTLAYHWRTNVAVLLGVIVGTAVMGGALIVGDSVRGSLRAMTLVRLGGVDHALHGPRFFREALAMELTAELAKSTGVRGQYEIAPALVVQTSIERRAANSANVEARAGKAQLYGIDDRFWQLTNSGGVPAPVEQQVLLSHRAAEQLGAKPGDAVVLVVEVPPTIPRDSLLGKRDDAAIEIPVTVHSVLEENSGAGRFGLQPDQQLPILAYVPFKLLQERLGLAAGAPKGDPPLPVEARCNALFVHAAQPTSETAARKAAQELTRVLGETWQLADLNLRVTTSEKGYVSLESGQMILDSLTADAGRTVAKKLDAATSPVMVYLANEISTAPNALSRYSVVAGIDPALFEQLPPFGPWQFVGPKLDTPLGEGELLKDGVGEIVLNSFLAQDLKAKVGDVVKMTYHLVGSHGELPEEARQFKVRGIVELRGTVADDRGLTPEVPGITDVETFDDWDQPFPMKKVTPRDDIYWGEFRATPKAFITLKSAQHLWHSRYGDLTSLRIAPPANHKGGLPEFATLVTNELRGTLKPEETGLVFRAVKAEGLAAAAGTTDFSVLFLAFSFFLILAALGLIGLLFRLGVERRAPQLGLLLASGFSPRRVRGLLLQEAAFVVIVGGLVGAAAAVGYAALMLHGLRTWWIGAIGTRFLDLYVTPLSVILGFVLAAGSALFAVWWRLRDLGKIPVRSLLSGVVEPPLSDANKLRRGRWTYLTAVSTSAVAALVALGVIVGIIPRSEAFMGISWPTCCFFIVGLSALTAGVSWLGIWIASDRTVAVRGRGLSGMARLGVRNAGRNRSRSVTTTALMATATFLITAIAAGHRNPAVETPDIRSGNGGFTLVAESPVPVLQDLDTPKGRDALNLTDDEATAALAPLKQSVAFRVNPGENASCLNIYQTSQPTILGVPPAMYKRGGFEFVEAREAEPWLRLEAPLADGVVPVLGDMNTLQYSLHKAPGAIFEIRDEQNRPVKVQVVGMFDGSVFQGVLLMSERHFRQLYPSRGYQYFLLDLGANPSKDETRKVSEMLESRIAGFDCEPVATRLADFLAVQNTYLSTFQTLGGLGLILGALGLAAVMLRNVVERRSELALMRACGFKRFDLISLVASENALLLVWGLATGTLSALIAMSPHLLTTGADFSWRDTGLILLAVLATGLCASLFAILEALRTPVLKTLRSE